MIKKKSRKISLLLFPIVLLVIIELVLRFTFYEQLKINHFPLIYAPHNEFGYTYIANSSGFVCKPSIEKQFKINQFGLYDQGSYNEKGDDNYYRIIVIGDSNESGIWMNSDSNYIFLLDRQFKESNFNVEVLNFGRDGEQKSISNIKFIEQYLTKFEPTHIIFNCEIPFQDRLYVRECYKGYVLSYNPNRIKSRSEAIKFIDMLERKYLFKKAYQFSYVFRAYCKKIVDKDANGDKSKWNKILSTYRNKRYYGNDLIFYSYSLEKSIEILASLNDFLNERAIELSILTYVKFSEEIVESLSENNINIIELKLNNLKFTEPLSHRHDGHFNEYGHEILSKQLYQQLIQDSTLIKYRVF